MKKIIRFFVAALCSSLLFYHVHSVNAATAVVVFAPGCKYISENFHYIAKYMIGQYFDELIIGPDIDAAYSQYSERAQKNFDADFAKEYDCDYFIQLYIGSVSSWDATHINAHTGHRSPLSMGSMSLSMVTADPYTDPLKYYNEGAAYYSNHGKFRNMELTDWDIYDEVFIRNLYYLIDTHYDHFWCQRGIRHIKETGFS